MCLGMHLALTNVKLVVAHLVHCFDWEIPNGMRHHDVDVAERFGLSMPRANKLLTVACYRLRVTHRYKFLCHSPTIFSYIKL